MIEEIKAKIGQCVFTSTLSALVSQPLTPIMALDIETFGCNKKPGDCPYYAEHGVAGVALGNMFGDSIYCLVKYRPDFDGMPLHDLIVALNALFERDIVKTVLIHYSKFDLGFLLHRGLRLPKQRVVDTWILRNIKSQGNYSANKLKEIMRKKFGIATDTEKEKDEWMEKHGTEDYGDVPVEIMAKYACDDPRYSLLAFLTEGEITTEDWNCHDTYVRNHFHLIHAEQRGVLINLQLMQSRMAIIGKAIEENQRKFKEALGAAQVDVEDDQAVMRYLHEKNLHSAKRELYGELQYVFDEEFLLSCDHPLSNSFYQLHRFKTFRNCFSGAQGEMSGNIFVSSEGDAGFHLSHLCSVFSKGGISQLRKPDVTERVRLTNEIRELFVPRKGHQFIHIRAHDLPALLIAFYTSNLELMAAIRMAQPDGVLNFLSSRYGLPEPKVVGLLLRQFFEGSGAERLLNRLRIAKVKGVGDKKKVYVLQDRFAGAIPGIATLKERLLASIKDNGTVSDRLGRVLRIEEKAQYRAQAVLLQSSYGSIMSYYLDIFSRLSYETGAHLVLAHDKEFLFEAPVGDDRFLKAAVELSQQKLIDPMPVWIIRGGQEKWNTTHLDSHESALQEL